jgi:hypothetical protein
MKLLSIFTLLAASAISAQAGNVLVLSPDSTALTVGDTVSLDVILTSTDPVFGYQFDLSYPTFLNFVSVVDEGDFAALGIGGGVPFSYDPPDDIDGIVTNVLDALTGDTPASDGAIVNFQFIVTDVGTANFSLANVILTDNGGNTLEADPVTAVSVTSSTPEPSTVWLAISGMALVFRRLRLQSGTGRRVIRRADI